VTESIADEQYVRNVVEILFRRQQEGGKELKAEREEVA
jgi:hypothetical protein